MKLLYLDTETTGLDPVKNGIHQISGIIEIDGKVVEEFDIKFRPIEKRELVSPEALKVSGLSVEDLRARTVSSFEAYGQLVKIFDKYIDRYKKTDKFNMVGQNTKFDYDFLAEWFRKHGNQYLYAYIFYHLIDIISTTAVFKLAGKMDVSDMKLATVAKFFGIELKAHDAQNDIRATREIFKRYLKLISQIPSIAQLTDEQPSSAQPSPEIQEAARAAGLIK